MENICHQCESRKTCHRCNSKDLSYKHLIDVVFLDTDRPVYTYFLDTRQEGSSYDQENLNKGDRQDHTCQNECRKNRRPFFFLIFLLALPISILYIDLLRIELLQRSLLILRAYCDICLITLYFTVLLFTSIKSLSDASL